MKVELSWCLSVIENGLNLHFMVGSASTRYERDRRLLRLEFAHWLCKMIFNLNDRD